jgi:hypothetical protein
MFFGGMPMRLIVCYLHQAAIPCPSNQSVRFIERFHRYRLMLIYFCGSICAGSKIHGGVVLGHALLLPRCLLLELVSIS